MTDATRTIKPEHLDSFTLEYIEAALFSTMDYADESGGEPLDRNYRAEDIHPETLATMVKDCQTFQASPYIKIEGREGLAGYHFWMTRNGHGTGFWNGDWDDDKDNAAALDAQSDGFGPYDLYVGDDGMIHGS